MGSWARASIIRLNCRPLAHLPTCPIAHSEWARASSIRLYSHFNGLQPGPGHQSPASASARTVQALYGNGMRLTPARAAAANAAGTTLAHAWKVLRPLQVLRTGSRPSCRGTSEGPFTKHPPGVRRIAVGAGARQSRFPWNEKRLACARVRVQDSDAPSLRGPTPSASSARAAQPAQQSPARISTLDGQDERLVDDRPYCSAGFFSAHSLASLTIFPATRPANVPIDS